jgi:hypothetical protein
MVRNKLCAVAVILIVMAPSRALSQQDCYWVRSGPVGAPRLLVVYLRERSNEPRPIRDVIKVRYNTVRWRARRERGFTLIDQLFTRSAFPGGRINETNQSLINYGGWVESNRLYENRRVLCNRAFYRYRPHRE